MTDTLLRQWVMLRQIPRYPRKVTVRALRTQLLEQGYAVTERTIQRDLLRLSGALFGLLLDDRSRPHGWSWDRDAAQLDIPGMEPQTALAFKLAEHFSGQLMAPATLNALAPYFQRAGAVLAEMDSPVSAWPEKIQTVTRGQTLIAPAIDPIILETVYDALFNDRQFRARYHRRYDDSVHDYVIHPLGIVFRDGVVYLICRRYGREGIAQMALHRMQSAEPLDAPAERPADFDLQRYIEDGGLDFRMGRQPLRLELMLDPATAVHLAETPLSDDQQMTESVDGRMQLRASVADTAQVRWWLLGLGDQVEVIAPETLRDEIAERLNRAAGQYRRPDGS
ncbi:helix-turn-helix transcriptional regulator [Spiribacter insolitus]|uniref:WYL domain-containing protein n=1 Tax=Spiribacter insolitus TaxID=3122417 RepID=A0ABV3T565_9GAMM